MTIDFTEAQNFIKCVVGITDKVEFDVIMRWCFENTVQEKVGIETIEAFKKYMKKTEEFALLKKSNEEYDMMFLEYFEDEECDCEECELMREGY